MYQPLSRKSQPSRVSRRVVFNTDETINVVPYIHRIRSMYLFESKWKHLVVAPFRDRTSFSIRYLAIQLVNVCDMLQASYCMVSASVRVIIFPNKRAKTGTNGPRREKTCHRGFRQSEFRTCLLIYRD